MGRFILVIMALFLMFSIPAAIWVQVWKRQEVNGPARVGIFLLTVLMCFAFYHVNSALLTMVD